MKMSASTTKKTPPQKKKQDIEELSRNSLARRANKLTALDRRGDHGDQ